MLELAKDLYRKNYEYQRFLYRCGITFDRFCIGVDEVISEKKQDLDATIAEISYQIIKKLFDNDDDQIARSLEKKIILAMDLETFASKSESIIDIIKSWDNKEINHIFISNNHHLYNVGILNKIINNLEKWDGEFSHKIAMLNIKNVKIFCNENEGESSNKFVRFCNESIDFIKKLILNVFCRVLTFLKKLIFKSLDKIIIQHANSIQFTPASNNYSLYSKRITENIYKVINCAVFDNNHYNKKNPCAYPTPNDKKIIKEEVDKFFVNMLDMLIELPDGLTSTKKEMIKESEGIAKGLIKSKTEELEEYRSVLEKKCDGLEKHKEIGYVKKVVNFIKLIMPEIIILIFQSIYSKESRAILKEKFFKYKEVKSEKYAPRILSQPSETHFRFDEQTEQTKMDKQT